MIFFHQVKYVFAFLDQIVHFCSCTFQLLHFDLHFFLSNFCLCWYSTFGSYHFPTSLIHDFIYLNFSLKDWLIDWKGEWEWEICWFTLHIPNLGQAEIRSQGLCLGPPCGVGTQPCGSSPSSFLSAHKEDAVSGSKAECKPGLVQVVAKLLCYLAHHPVDLLISLSYSLLTPSTWDSLGKISVNCPFVLRATISFLPCLFHKFCWKFGILNNVTYLRKSYAMPFP